MKKDGLKHYLKENNIDIYNTDFIRRIYIGDKRTNYMITKYGDVISIRKNSDKKLNPTNDKDGYLHVSLYINGKPYTCRINRLVALTFIPNDDPINKTQVNHIDGNKINNMVDNLEWTTPKENIQHAWNNNLANAKEGNDHPNTIYKDDIIKIICEHFVENLLTMKQISELTGVPYTIVKQVKNHVIHNNISSQYDFSHYNKNGKKKYTKDQLILAIALIRNGYKNKSITDLTGISNTTISKIKKNKINLDGITDDDINKYYNEYIKSQEVQ